MDNDGINNAEWEIEEVLDHQTTIFGTYYLIKWANYSEEYNIWNFEDDMRVEVINEYRKARNLDMLDEQSENEKPLEDQPTDNFVTPDIIIRTINSKRTLSAYNDPSITVIHYFGQAIDITQKLVLVLLYKGHYYIIAIKDKKAYIADGVNNNFGNQQLHNKLTRSLGITKLFSIEYNYQQYEDHCGASAVLLTLEFIRIFKANTLMPKKEIQPPIKMAAEIIKRLHPYKSNKDQALDAAGVPVNLRDIRRRRCFKCGKYYPKRQTLLQHEARCG